MWSSRSQHDILDGIAWSLVLFMEQRYAEHIHRPRHPGHDGRDLHPRSRRGRSVLNLILFTLALELAG
jgi:hypothetical protein